MRSRFRLALMWLLLLALPAQGLAAATMINCGPNHHRMWAEAERAEGHEHVVGRQHQHGTSAAPRHHEVASNVTTADAPLVHHLDKLMKFKCSACAACCMGAALPTAAVTFEPVAPAFVPGSFVSVSHVGFVTDGPDRPPRLSLV